MSTFPSSIDYSGARGSNTGDQFHELWAMQQVLELLTPETDLKAVGVEGVRTVTPPQNDDNPTWDGVDCTLYYGGTTLENADKIEFIQLKYSAANPKTAWSVARLTKNTARKGNNSIIRKMAEDFKDATTRLKQGTKLKIRLVSNQAASPQLKKALDARWSGSLKKASMVKKIQENLLHLKKVTGLGEKDFQVFLKTLDFSECGTHSRFASKARVIKIVAGLLGDDVSSEVRDLQQRVRELMLPERSREVVTEHDILLWFNLSGRKGLFPCPTDIQLPESAIERLAANETVKLLTKGERLVLIHGGGGCGKTTLINQIENLLPEESVTIFFDCFGGGRYIYSDDKRHLPENAFLHLANELAVVLQLPLFIPRNNKYPATVQSFLTKVRSAGNALKQIAPDGILLIVVDAADNSVLAAQDADPPEYPFVFDLFKANLSDLPDNIRFIVSCRTARCEILQLPPYTHEVICPPFSLKETREHLSLAFPNLDEIIVEDFHNLSNANPRVQAYAVTLAEGDKTNLLKALLPGGKSLPEVLRAKFDNALKKIGPGQLFKKLIGLFAYLPAPIAMPAIARIVGCNIDVVHDFILDLSPGLRIHDNTVSIADEDFESFIKDNGAASHETIIADIAEDFLSTFKEDPYSSIHVADTLIKTDRAKDILSVIEQDPHAKAIGDPIVRRQVQLRRLKLSLAACSNAGSTTDALKTILMSAEAERDDSTVRELLENELDLSVEFSGASLRRAILLDPDRVEQHGSFLTQDAVRAIRKGDRVTAKEQLYFHQAWLRRRRDVADNKLRRWVVSYSDISARVETILEIAGPKDAFEEIMGWTPRETSLKVAFMLTPQLIAKGKVHHIKGLLSNSPPSAPWDLLLWVPLAMSGEPVNAAAIEKSLRRIRSCFIPDVAPFSFGSEVWQVELLDIFITACELAFKLKLNSQVILNSLNRMTDALEGKNNQVLHGLNIYRIDGLIRCWLLKKVISGETVKDDYFIEYLKFLNQKSVMKNHRGKKDKKKRVETKQTSNRNDDRLFKKIRAIFPVYSARIEILATARKKLKFTDDQIDKLSSLGSHSYEFDQDYDSSYFRDIIAKSIMGLLIIEDIEASKLVNHASKVAQGRFSDWFVSHRLKVWHRMRLRTSESNKLLDFITKAAENIKQTRAASSEKMNALIQLSRLILPVSRDDAESLFNDAVDIANEIDHEAFEQINFLSVLASNARITDQHNRKKTTADIFTFVSGAAERLSGYDSFPWEAAVHALTCVDDIVALAAICRWADDGTASLYDTLDEFLVSALQRSRIDLEVSTSLALLIEGSAGILLKDSVAGASAALSKHNNIIEELAKDILILSSQSLRLKLGKEIIDRIPIGSQEGPWLKQLRETITFLRQIAKNKPEKKTEIISRVTNKPINNNDRQKEFKFDSQGKPFITPESIAEVLKAAHSSGFRYDVLNLLKNMRDVSSEPRYRVSFLNALAEAPDDLLWSAYRGEIINETLTVWGETPAVKRWCKEVLPEVLVKHFLSATRWLSIEQSVLHQLIDYTGLNDEGCLKIILEGVAHVGQAMNSRVLFAIAKEIVRFLDAESTAGLLIWYARRLRNRLPQEDQSLYTLTDIPNTQTDAIARFLFAFMSDIDTRIRWKAAHCLRRLAKLGRFDIVKAVVSQSNRVGDNTFRDPAGPFYFIAAKLWLNISLYRISAETPEALSSIKAQILDIAISSGLPHVGIREYAKRTLLQLDASGTISLTPPEKRQIDLVNVAIKGKTNEHQKPYRSFGAFYDTFQNDKRRFKFDGMDTLRYWYDKILRIFPTVTQDQILDMAERWIVDQWGVGTEAHHWDKEHRKGRYDERRFGLWSHRHGSQPVVERYATYLEWNAMYCVVGELLTTHPISRGDESWLNSFEYWLERILLSEPPLWLSDIRGPTPLENRLWTEDPKTDKGWLHSIRRDEFLSEIVVPQEIRKGWIVVDGSYTAHFSKRESTIRISSALVSPETSHALVRALQTASDPWDFRIPDENDELQIDTPTYYLGGWIAHKDGDLRFDDHDPFRYEVLQVRAKPGRKFSEMFNLVPQPGTNRIWINAESDEEAIIYEAWCDEPPPERDHFPRSIRTNGWRLWAKADIVQSFLNNGGWDLICEVQIERRLRNEYGQSYEPNEKRKTHEKIILLKGDGSINDIKRRIGTWTSIGRGTGS